MAGDYGRGSERGSHEDRFERGSSPREVNSQRDVSRMIGQAMSPIVLALLIARCLLAVPGIGITLDELVKRGSPLALTA